MSSDEDNIDPFIYERRVKVYKPRINFDDNNFKEKFRISPQCAENLVNMIGDILQSPTQRSHALSPKEKLLTTLTFLATGSFYHLDGNAHGISKSSVCRSVKQVIQAINQRLFDTTITWPQGNELHRIAQDFYRLADFPRVAGCIDGTLIKIKAPSVDEENFVDRHGNHSLNCMVVCGPSLKAYYVSSRWPGRLNDKRVLRNSELDAAFERGWRPFPNAILLGDSGYGLKQWLLPPIGGGIHSLQEEDYNRRHRSTRRVIECFFGVLKQRFNCLQIPLRVNPTYAGEIFKTCCVLQNLISSQNEQDQEIPIIENIANDDADIDGPNLGLNDPRREFLREI